MAFSLKPNIGDPSTTPTSTSSGAVAAKSPLDSATPQFTLSITGLEGKEVNELESNQAYTAIIAHQDGSVINSTQFFMTGLRLLSMSQADEKKVFLAPLGPQAQCIKGTLEPTSCNLLSLADAGFKFDSNPQQNIVSYTTKITIPTIVSSAGNDYFIDFLWADRELASVSMSFTSDIQANHGATFSISSSTALGSTPTSSSSSAPQISDTAPPAATIASTTTSSTPSSTGNALANFTDVNGKSEPASSSSSELSTGAKAGIGIGAAVGALAILGLIFFFFIRNRRNKRQAAHEHAYGSHELSPTGTGELGIEKELNVTSSTPIPAWHGDAGAAGAAGETSRGLDRSGSGAAASAGEDRWSRGSAGLGAAGAGAGAGAAGGALASNPPRASESLHSMQGLMHGHEIPRRPVGGEAVAAAPAKAGVLTDEERARWEEEERRLDEDIAEAERRRGGSVG